MKVEEAAADLKQEALFTFDATDRCDACGSQAYVSASMESGDLFFCGHHWHQYMDKIMETALFVRDETSFIR